MFEIIEISIIETVNILAKYDEIAESIDFIIRCIEAAEIKFEAEIWQYLEE